MSRVVRGTIRAALLLPLLLQSCAGPAPEREPVRAVARRLTASDFGLPLSAAHRPVVKIGDQARTVAVAPRALEIATLRGVLLDAGTASAEIELPAEARTLPDDAFDLSVQVLPFTTEVPAKVFDFLATETFHEAVASTWTIARAPGGARARLEIRPENERVDVRLNVDVRALLPQPTALESVALAIPEGASIELGYGIAAVSGALARETVRFRAGLRCASGAETTLLDQTITPGEEPPAWRAVTRPVPAGDGCRLGLDTTAANGDAVRAAVWAEPLLFAPLPRRVRPRVDNVVVISLDTLRADRLSGYGYPRATSPAIDARLIARGTAFDDVSTTFTRTDVSHLSLFTSLFPDAQPVPGRLKAEASAALLTESLRDAGLVTAAFTEDAMLAGAFGFWFGFDFFVERAFTEHERGKATFADGTAFLRSNAEHRFFLFLHTYKTHTPYVTPERYAAVADPADWDTLPLDQRVPPAQRPNADAYDRTVREADDLVASLLAELDRLGLAERTLIVLLSDHGEAFGEHHVLEHGYAAHQEQLRIPLVFRGPGVPAGARVATPASIVDVAPTVLELAGAAPLPDAQGISLAPAFAGRDLPRTRPLFFSWLADQATGVRHGNWKYLRSANHHELFDLAADPLELLPRGRGRPARPVETLLLAEHRAESALLRERFNRGVGAASADVPIDERMQESLRALGYVD